jgi:hypothetical protein
MPDDVEPATTYTSTIDHLRGVAVTVTITVPIASNIGHRVASSDLQRYAAEGTSFVVDSVLGNADAPPF